jgi:hypothetical protein
VAATHSAYVAYSEQDTADKLILPYLATEFGFPAAASLDYQAQHTLRLDEDRSGRYDGLYLSGGYPYVILEAKRYAHELTEGDIGQARAYATGPDFDRPVPFLVVSNGREHVFYKRSETIDLLDGRLRYDRITPTPWKAIIADSPGNISRLLDEKELIRILLDIKAQAFRDISASFLDPITGKYDKARHAQLSGFLNQVLEERKKFIGQSTSSEQLNIRQAIEAISLHFTTKILFIKLIEDISAGSDTPRIIHTLFPRLEYNLVGGLFGSKVFHALNHLDETHALRLFAKSKRFYRLLAQDLAEVSWQDIFRYGFSFHSAQYGKLFKAQNYDRFLPSEETLASIRDRLIRIDIRSAVLYGEAAKRLNVIGNIYERLIDDQLRSSIGAVYTPDVTVRFMIALGHQYLGKFRGHKILEPACGSGHFYKQIYRDYVDEVIQHQTQYGPAHDNAAAHAEALEHIFGRDVDPFAVQLTLLGTFLEQLKDNVRPASVTKSSRARQWAANLAIDTQNSLDPITIDPELYFDLQQKTLDLSNARSRQASCHRSLRPDLIIGNPPYGVAVQKGTHYDQVYDLGSPDSYGYFIANALKRLPEGRRVIFIVSSSFLTIKTHCPLRLTILDNSKIIRLIKLNRNMFPGIDIFPVIVELERCSDRALRDQNMYQFFDLWQLHPESDMQELKTVYQTILDDAEGTRKWPFERTRTARYQVRQGVIRGFSRLPLFEGRASLYAFMQDVFTTVAAEIEVETFEGQSRRVRPKTIRGRHVVKLSDIGEVKIGLQCGDNSRFYRAAAGVRGGATRGGYQQVDPRLVASPAMLAALTVEEKARGIQVDDQSTDRYFVPLDKAATSDIDGGLLAQFWRPIEFYVDWSEQAVSRMRALPSAVFRNSQFYFRRGVSFSNTGIYSPTFRLSHGGVFDQTGSCIFSDVFSPEVLLGLLSSTLMKYFAKAFINHGVHAQLDDLPIVIPTAAEIGAIAAKIDEIVVAQYSTSGYDYRPKLAELDSIVFDIYNITNDEREEIVTWYMRHYPKLFNAKAEEA